MMEYAVERVYNAIDDEERFFVVYKDGSRVGCSGNLAGPYNSVDAAFVVARRIQSNNGTVSRILYDIETGRRIEW